MSLTMVASSSCDRLRKKLALKWRKRMRGWSDRRGREGKRGRKGGGDVVDNNGLFVL